MLAIPGKSGLSLVAFWLLTILAASIFFCLVVPALGIPLCPALAIMVPVLVLLTCVVSGRCTFNSDFWALFLVGTIGFVLYVFAESLLLVCSPVVVILLASLSLVSSIIAAAVKKGVFPFGLPSQERTYVYSRLFFVAAIAIVLSSLLSFGLCDTVVWGDTYSKGSDLLFPKLSTSFLPGFVLGLNGLIASILVFPFLLGMNSLVVRSIMKRGESGDSAGIAVVTLSLAMVPICLGLLPFVYAVCVQVMKGGISHSEVRLVKNALLLSIALSTIPQSFLGMQVALSPGRAAGDKVDRPPVRKSWQIPYIFLFLGLVTFGLAVGPPLCLQAFDWANPYSCNCLKGQLLYLMGKQRAAIHFYDSAMAIEPTNLEAYVSKGNILLGSGRSQEAAVTLQKGYDQGACSPWLLRMLVQSYETQGKDKAASKYRAHFLLNYPKHLEWCKLCREVVSERE